MPSVLIAGCGYVGGVAADLFQNAGWTVEGWTKSAASTEQASQKHYLVRAVDLSNASEVSACGSRFELVIHCASTRGGDVALYRQVYADGMRNLFESFPDSTILFVSSTSVYAQTSGEWITEESPAAPEHERGKILREAEQIVLERGGIVARFAGIYGPRRSYLLQRFLTGEAVIDSKNDRFVNQVHRDDAASALFLLAGLRSNLSGEVFNVSDGQSILQTECYRWLAAKLDRPLPPRDELKMAGKRGRSNKRVSNAKLRDLGWAPRYPNFAEAMDKSILPSFLSKSPV
jgi:nucleoside-diphosphate-sugar epimerase